MDLPSRIIGTHSANNISTRRVVATQLPEDRVLPVQVYPEQRFDAISQGLNPYDSNPEASFARTPQVELYLRTVHDGSFLVADGLDGVIVMPDGRAMEEPSCFSTLESTGQQRDIGEIAVSDEMFEDVFVAFDGAWGNYYHWLLYGLGKASIAFDGLPAGCRIAVPDYASRKPTFHIGYSEATYEQSIAAVGRVTVGSAEAWERDHVVRLKRGRYRARRIHFLWTIPRLPTDLLYVDAFYAPFAKMRTALHHRDDAPRRLLVSREKAYDRRMDEAAQAILSRLAESHGFVRVFFEDMSFDEQAAAVFNADCIIAPHGAGLCNILFGRDTLRVLELNTDLDGAGYVRACFYQLAVQRGQTYLTLNGSQGDFTGERLDAAMRRLIAGQDPA